VILHEAQKARSVNACATCVRRTKARFREERIEAAKLKTQRMRYLHKKGGSLFWGPRAFLEMPWDESPDTLSSPTNRSTKTVLLLGSKFSEWSRFSGPHTRTRTGNRSVKVPFFVLAARRIGLKRVPFGGPIGPRARRACGA
jgi:hypothetical protein